MIPSELFSHSALFIFAHPDDEVYCCDLMHQLVAEGRRVTAVYLTSGDAGGDAEMRESEVRSAMRTIGIADDHFMFLQIPEKEIDRHLSEIVGRLCEIARRVGADGIVGHDYEGGHEVHDFACFCASEVVRREGIKTHIVFPVYHGKTGERIAAQFKPERGAIITLPFTAEDMALKKAVLACHASQQKSFALIGVSTPSYLDLLCSREVFAVVDQPIDFTQKPMTVIGYESHRNKFTFERFRTVLEEYMKIIDP